MTTFKQEFRVINREAAAGKRAAGITQIARHGRGQSGTVFQEPSLPDDTRTFTARFCGDPLPGRSALDRRPQSTGDRK